MRVKIVSGGIGELGEKEQFRKDLEDTYNSIKSEAQLAMHMISPMITQIIESRGGIHVIIAYDLVPPPRGAGLDTVVGRN